MADLHYLPVSLGEAMDKLSILDIKLEKIEDERRNNVEIEFNLLFKMLETDITKYNLFYKIMKIVNLEIWDLMNLLRDANEFNNEYMILCKECIIKNDIRFRIKNKINFTSNCSLKEQKGYKKLGILFDLRNEKLNNIDLIKPIKYYSFLYDEIVILSNIYNKDLFEKEFSYDPTINIILEPLEKNIIYKKVFNLQKLSDTSLENIYKILEITEEIISYYFNNF